MLRNKNTSTNVNRIKNKSKVEKRSSSKSKVLIFFLRTNKYFTEFKKGKFAAFLNSSLSC